MVTGLFSLIYLIELSTCALSHLRSFGSYTHHGCTSFLKMGLDLQKYNYVVLYYTFFILWSIISQVQVSEKEVIKIFATVNCNDLRSSEMF